jgi:4-aminobutyrate aminotransferase-like enzyme
MSTQIELKELAEGRKYLLSGSVGGELPLLLVNGKGSVVKDINDKEYIDCTSQAWSYNVGFSHPKVIEAAIEQIKHGLTHCRTSFETIPKLRLLKKMGETAPGNLKKISFCLHGSVANEGALKLAMINKPNAFKFLAPYDNYAGRTLATIAASWPYPPISRNFAPFMQNFIRVPNAYCYRCPFGLKYPDCNLLCAEFIKTTLERGVEPVAALIMEPLQASGGMIPPPEGYLKRVKEICNEYGVLLIFDEVQTGFGRLGEMFASELYDTIPDILTFGKGIGGGFPLFGVMLRDDLKGYEPATHSFTFAHFPVAMATACATLDVIKEENLLENVRKMGEYITGKLLQMKEKYELIGDVRGPGLMIGIELVKNKETKEPACKEATQFIKEGVKRGVIFGESKFRGVGNVVKIKPPFVITKEQADRVLEVFEEITCLLSPK